MAYALRSFEYWAYSYRRVWRGSVVTSIVGPVLYLTALGVGLGTIVNKGNKLGVPYLDFVAPGHPRGDGDADRDVRVVVSRDGGDPLDAAVPRDARDAAARARSASSATSSTSRAAWRWSARSISRSSPRSARCTRRSRSSRCRSSCSIGLAHSRAGDGVLRVARARRGLQRALPLRRHADVPVLRDVLPRHASAASGFARSPTRRRSGTAST